MARFTKDREASRASAVGTDSVKTVMSSRKYAAISISNMLAFGLLGGLVLPAISSHSIEALSDGKTATAATNFFAFNLIPAGLTLLASTVKCALLDPCARKDASKTKPTGNWYTAYARTTGNVRLALALVTGITGAALSAGLGWDMSNNDASTQRFVFAAAAAGFADTLNSIFTFACTRRGQAACCFRPEKKAVGGQGHATRLDSLVRNGSSQLDDSLLESVGNL